VGHNLGCRCSPACRETKLRYERWRRAEMKAGRPLTVPVGPVRQHVLDLAARGVGVAQVARLAGVAELTVSNMVFGAHRAVKPARRCNPMTARKLLAVTFDVDRLTPGTVIDACGARRRLQALNWEGWTQRELARRLGVRPAMLSVWLVTRTVTVATHRRVAALHAELIDRDPPEATPNERKWAHLARTRAVARGWVPVLAWSDVDDPAATVVIDVTTPAVIVDEVAVQRVVKDRAGPETLRRPELLEAARIMATREQLNVRAITTRLHISSHTLKKALADQDTEVAS
jgi:DNA-binding transcriptional regulator YdaS (Cro superfamily)